MYICPICGHRDPEEKSCPTCGVMLVEEVIEPEGETLRVEIVEGGGEEQGLFPEEEMDLPISKAFKPSTQKTVREPSTALLGEREGPAQTGETGEGSSAARWVLVITHRKEVLQEIPLEGELVVGRFSRDTGPVDVDLSQLPGAEYVSRRHMRIYTQNGHVFVEDLGSTNGVYVNKVRIGQPTQVGPEDRIRVGILLFRIRPA